MFDRTKIKKIFFISENRKGLVLNDRALLCDDKDEIIKEWKGNSIDLIKIKNSSWVAVVHREMGQIRDPRARRLAVTGENMFLPGKTELMHIDKLDDKPFIIPYGVSEGFFLNDQFLGFSGLRVIVCDFKKMNDYPLGMVYNASNFISLNDSLMMGTFQYGNDVGVLHLKNNTIYTTMTYPLKLKKICALTNDRFFAQAMTGELMVFFISEPRQVSLLRKICYFSLQRQVSFHSLFKEILLLPDSPIVLGRDPNNDLYVIHSETLQIRKIDLKIKEPILEINISENNRVIAVLESGNYLWLDDKILKDSYVHDIFLEETTQPTVLIDMMVNYTLDYVHLFKNSQKPEEKEYVPKKNMI